MTQSFQYINLEYLEMMTHGDKDMQKEILAMLLEEFKTEIPKMKTLHETKNWEELRQVSHKFKSTVSYVGNELMADANKEVEQIAKSGGGFEKIGPLMTIIESLEPRIHQELQLAMEAL